MLLCNIARTAILVAVDTTFFAMTEFRNGDQLLPKIVSQCHTMYNTCSSIKMKSIREPDGEREVARNFYVVMSPWIIALRGSCSPPPPPQPLPIQMSLTNSPNLCLKKIILNVHVLTFYLIPALFNNVIHVIMWFFSKNVQHALVQTSLMTPTCSYCQFPLHWFIECQFYSKCYHSHSTFK